MSIRTRVAVCSLVGVIAALFFYRVRGFFPEHAFLLGLAIAALTYSLVRAIDNLRSGPGQIPPWDENQGGNE
ncbi:MAG: hypothetical protein ACE5GX_05840 [Thermoanaerobaculia bacterium]